MACKWYQMRCRAESSPGGKFTGYQPINLYRKFKADELFTGSELITGNKVLITDAAGTVSGIVDMADAGDDIESFSGTISPGFINCHCHLELSHLKGIIPRQNGLVDFIIKVVGSRQVDEDLILEAIRLGEAEMIKDGIVAVGDICNTSFTAVQKSKGKLVYHNFIEAIGFLPSDADRRFGQCLELYQQFSAFTTANSIVPHAPYSVSPELLQRINAFMGNNLLSMHNQETADENEFFEKGTGELRRLYELLNINISFFLPTGKSSLQSTLPYVDHFRSMILVHNVDTTVEDTRFSGLHAGKINGTVYYCLCPNANRYISNRLPDVHSFDALGLRLVLGTDSLASNDRLSILEEMRTIREHFPGISLEKLLTWATSNGAAALDIADRFGSFEKGKKPGVLLIGPGLSGVSRLV